MWPGCILSLHGNETLEKKNQQKKKLYDGSVFVKKMRVFPMPLKIHVSRSTCQVFFFIYSVMGIFEMHVKKTYFLKKNKWIMPKNTSVGTSS